MSFQDLGLDPRILLKLQELGFDKPTPIQTQAIPFAMAGRDVMGLAQTGTGKTAAFGLPLLHRLSVDRVKPRPKHIHGLVLAPTRELVKQIHDSLKPLSDNLPLKLQVVVGGVSVNAQINRLNRGGADLMIATPGRLLDLIKQGALFLDEASFLVLDEADQMLDMGFIHDLRKIAELLPEKRQTMLFSATMPKLMAEISKSYLTNPERVQVSPPGKVADKITQELHFVSQASKMGLLMELLEGHKEDRTLVFSRTKHGAEKMKRQLENAGFAAGSIHGNKSQGQRDRALAGFKDGSIKVLIATDVAARGIDIPEVKYVYNYELPNVPDNYVHRIGRTARAGASGKAIAFCGSQEMGELKDIQKVMKMEIPVASGRAWAPEEQTEKPKQGGGRRRGGGGGRPQGGKPRSGGKPSGGKPAGGGGRRRKPGGGKPSGAGRRK
ncbi:MAG: DEAD/DEAH box helicase [Halocynthiibacter sp.]